MDLSELKVGQGKVDMDLTVKSVSDVRVFNKYGKDLKVANAVVSDGKTEMKFTLWNDDATKFKAGDKVTVTNGYVSEFNGLKQLSTGKFGKIELAGASAAPKMSAKSEDMEEVEF